MPTIQTLNEDHMNERRAFFGKLFTASAVALAAAQETSSETLIVVPQPDPVELYHMKDMPSPVAHWTNRDRDLLSVSHMNEIVTSINRLNLAVFGSKTCLLYTSPS